MKAGFSVSPTRYPADMLTEVTETPLLEHSDPTSWPASFPWKLTDDLQGVLASTGNGWEPAPTINTSEFGLNVLSLRDERSYTLALASLTLGHILADFLNEGEFTPNQVAGATYPVSSYKNATGQIIGAWAALRLLGDPVIAPASTRPSYSPAWAFATLPSSIDCTGVLQKLYKDIDIGASKPSRPECECVPDAIAVWLLALYSRTFHENNAQTDYPQPCHAASEFGIQTWADDPTHLARVYADIVYASELHSPVPDRRFRLSPYSEATACLWLSEAALLGNDYEAFQSWWVAHNRPSLDTQISVPPEGKPHTENLVHSLLVLILDGDPRLRESAAVVFRTLWGCETIYSPAAALGHIISATWRTQNVKTSFGVASPLTVWRDTATLMAALEDAFGPAMCDLPGAYEQIDSRVWATIGRSARV